MVLGALVAGISIFILISILIFAVGYFLGNLKSTKKFVLSINVFEGLYEEEPDPEVVAPIPVVEKENNKVTQIRKETIK